MAKTAPLGSPCAHDLTSMVRDFLDRHTVIAPGAVIKFAEFQQRFRKDLPAKLRYAVTPKQVAAAVSTVVAYGRWHSNQRYLGNVKWRGAPNPNICTPLVKVGDKLHRSVTG